jgi:hypothetical protein
MRWIFPFFDIGNITAGGALTNYPPFVYGSELRHFTFTYCVATRRLGGCAQKGLSGVESGVAANGDQNSAR